MSTWGDMYAKAVSADLDSTRDYCLEMEPPDLPLGSPMGKLLWGPLRYGRWPMGQLPKECRQPAHSDVETLLLSGSIDFSTPAEFAQQELLPYLKNGRQIILSEYGHMDMETLAPDNARRILSSFYDTGLPDTSMNERVPMDFSVIWPLPVLAKAGISAIVSLATGIVVLIVWLVRKAWVAR